MPEVSTFKGQFVANIFSLLFAAGRACLIPFLTIYFYYLGLSPIQTGLVLGLKSFTSVWSALCWIKYVGTPKRKRCVLVFSIMVLMLTHLAMMLMPTMNSTKASSFCPSLMNHSSLVPCSNGSSSDHGSCLYDSTSDFASSSVPFGEMSSELAGSSSVTSILSTSVSQSSSTVKSSRASEVDGLAKIPVTPSTVQLKSSTERHVAAPITHKPYKLETLFDAKGEEHNTHPPIYKETNGNQNGIFATAVPTTVNSNSTSETNDDYDYDSFGNRRKRAIEQQTQTVDNKHDGTVEDDSDNSAIMQTPGEKEASSEDHENSVDQLLKSLNSIQHQVFVALLVLVLVGEMFSSPTEQLTEDLWLRFLDSFEKLDKIHIPKLWSSFGAALTPWAVVLLIEYLPCILPILHLPRIFIHFFCFEIIIAMALLLSFCFPVAHSDGMKIKKWSRLMRGLRAVCGDVHSFVCMFTVIVVGFIYGFINTFLFWVMHEQTESGSELALGISLTVASAGEFFMSFIAGWVVKKLKCPISIILGLVVLCARCILYSFLFNPWIAVVGEAGHMLSHTIIWAAVRNYSAFRINPLVMDTSAYNALNLVYSGFGVSSGCMIAGLCYSWLGQKMMFQIAACVAGSWCILFAIIYKCCSQWKKQRVRYTKIAQDEIADSDASEDDWLDSAVKRKN